MDWYDSMRGNVAVRNLFWIELFDAAMRELPRQRIGFYLCENQAWERALIHAWRRHGHGRLIGVVHATVRFWDFRHFTDPRGFQGEKKDPIPQPDNVVLNGKAALDVYIQGGNPLDKIVECEALRFLYLGGLKPENRESAAFRENVLVLGGVMRRSTNKVLSLLEAAIHLIPNEFRYTMKSHPNCIIISEDYPALELEDVNEPLGQIMRRNEIAYAANTTSAAVDAYLAGLPVVVMLDGDELNMSPLRGHSGVQFVSTAEELAKAFKMARDSTVDEFQSKDFFFLDPELPRWRALLLEAHSGRISRKS